MLRLRSACKKRSMPAACKPSPSLEKGGELIPKTKEVWSKSEPLLFGVDKLQYPVPIVLIEMIHSVFGHYLFTY